MRALEILNRLIKSENWEDYYPSSNDCKEAIKEIEDLIQENKTLIKTLEMYNLRMINLRIENQEFKNKEMGK